MITKPSVPSRRRLLTTARLACLLLAPGAITVGGCSYPTTIAVVNYGGNSVTEYPANANGNAAPSATLAGSNTGLHAPGALARDSVGALYIGNSVLLPQIPCCSITYYLLGAEGNSAPIGTIAGPNADLRRLWGIALDSAGNIYVAQRDSVPSSKITVYARGAMGDTAPIATIAGSNTGLSGATDIAVDGAGKIYVANNFSPASGGPEPGSVLVYAPGANGNVPPIATISGPHTGLDQENGLAVDLAGTVYVLNWHFIGQNGWVTVYPPGATGDVAPVRTISGSNTSLTVPYRIAVDADGSIYVTSPQSGGEPDKIVVFGPGANGNVSPRAIISGDQTGLNGPFGVTILPPESAWARFRRLLNQVFRLGGVLGLALIGVILIVLFVTWKWFGRKGTLA